MKNRKSSKNISNASNGGLSITTIVFIVFLILKLTNNIDWSWIWVLSPFWIPIAIFLSVVGIIITMIVAFLFFILLYMAYTGKNLLK